MRTIRITSFVLFAITIFCSYLWYQIEFEHDTLALTEYATMSQASINFNNSVDSLRNLQPFSSGDSTEIKEFAAQMCAVDRDYSVYRGILDSSEIAAFEYAIEAPEKDPRAFWIKVIFSFLFAGAALYVVLANKYDDDTKKWAFNVLTLISGIWIGTISAVV